MQVSQLADYDTHAVLGGGVAQSFGIADTPEFYTVLSDTLYRDKKLAVVRETICNGYDAHIAADIPHLPVEILLSKEELIIRDFGKGIPADKMVPTYCVYGLSTKVADEKQTGGFGLGCKAPFAYSDHFTVCSKNGGFSSIYAISRGSSETQGKPDCRQMVRVPCAETGLTVTIPLRSEGDYHAFRTLIREVVFRGGIKATLNGEELPTIDYSEARERGFLMVDPQSFQNGNHNLIHADVYLAYGNVIYPVTTEDKDVSRALTELKNVTSTMAVVLVAKPGSVGITPSREALSYTDRTTETVKRLLKRATSQIKAHIPGAKKSLARKAVAVSRAEVLREMRLSSNVLNKIKLPAITADPALMAECVTAECVTAGRVRYGSDIPHKTILAALVTKEDSRRRIMKGYDRWRTKAPYFEEARPFIKLALELGLSKKLFTVGGKCIFYNVREGEFSRLDTQTLLVGPNQRDVLAYRNANRPTDHFGHQMVLTVPNLTQEQRRKIEAWSEDRGIDVEWIERSEAPKKENKGAGDFHYHRLTGCGLDGIEPLRETDEFFIQGEVDKHGHMMIGLSREKLRRLWPETVVTRGVLESRRLTKAGLKDLREEIAQEARKLLKNRSFLFGFTVHSNLGAHLWPYDYYNPCAADKLARLDPRIAKVLLRENVKVTGPDAERAFLIGELVSGITSVPDELYGTIAVQAKEKLTCLQSGWEPFSTRFIRLLNANRISDANADDLLALVKMMTRADNSSK